MDRLNKNKVTTVTVEQSLQAPVSVRSSFKFWFSLYSVETMGRLSINTKFFDYHEVLVILCLSYNNNNPNNW